MSTPTPPPSPTMPLMLLEWAPKVPDSAPTERADETADLAELFSVASLEATKPEASQEEVAVVRAMVELFPKSWGLSCAKPHHIEELIELVVSPPRKRRVQSRVPAIPLPPPIRRQIAKKDTRITLLKRGESSVRGGSVAPRLCASAPPLPASMLVPELLLPPPAAKSTDAMTLQERRATPWAPGQPDVWGLSELSSVQERD